MKKLLFIIPFLLNAQILSPLQQKLLDKDLNKAVVSGDKLKNSWINPIILQYKKNRSNQIESNIQTTNQFGVSINQPIFKSGAIWASVKYAKYLKNENLEKINLQKRTLIKQAYDILLNIHKINISIQKQKLLIKNANIDIQRKKEQYLSGILDSSFLDNAILNKNNLEVALEDLVFKKKELIDNFKTLSDLDYKSVALPHLELISKNKYLTNLNLKIAKQNIKVKKALKGMNLGNSLVSVNFLANYTNIDTKYSKQTLLYQNDISNFYNIGFSVTIPLDVNTPKTIQESKIDYLKSVLEYRDKVSQSISQYDTQIANIKAIDKKIDIYKNSIATYNSLIEATKNNIKAGTSTDLDLETLQNSKQINQLNIESLQIDKQSVLLELYYLVGPLK